MNKTYVVHRPKKLNVNGYAVSRNLIKSKPKRRNKWGGAGMGGTAERFGPPLGFFVSFLGQAKKENERLR